MAVHVECAPERVQFRRLIASPDGGVDFLATTNERTVRVFRRDVAARDAGRRPFADGHKDAPRNRVELPAPAMDAAWCGTKRGDADAAFVTTCRGAPVTLWEAADGAPRASYVLRNPMDEPVVAQALAWGAPQATATTASTTILAGLGVRGDPRALVAIDATREGDQCVVASYAPKNNAPSGSARGLVGCVAPLSQQCAHLAAVGFLAHASCGTSLVELVDLRASGGPLPAGALFLPPEHRGNGVAHVAGSPVDPFAVFASARATNDTRATSIAVVMFDLRNMLQPAAVFPRASRTAQHMGFALSPDGRELFAATHGADESGPCVLRYATAGGASPSVVPLDAAAAGLPGSVAVVDAGRTLAVAVGSRTFPLRDRYAERGGAAEDKDDDDDEGDEPFATGPTPLAAGMIVFCPIRAAV